MRETKRSPSAASALDESATVQGLSRFKHFHSASAPESLGVDKLEYKPKNTYNVRPKTTIQPQKLKIPKELQQFNHLDPSRNTSTKKRETSTTTTKRASAQEKSRKTLEERPPKQAKYTTSVSRLSELNSLNVSARIGALKQMDVEEGTIDVASYPRLLIINKEFSEEEKDIIMSGQEIESKSKFLPLELFDDEEIFEKFTIEDLLSNSYIVQSKFYTGAKSAYEKSYKWARCRVLEYNPDERSFLIEWLDSPNTTGYEITTTDENNDSPTTTNGRKQKWVKRLNLLVHGDETFELRIRFAQMRRKKFEEKMFYYLQIDKTITDDLIDITPFEKQIYEKILKLVANESQFLSRHVPVIEKYVDEAKEHYKISMKEAIFLYYLNSREEYEKYEKYLWCKEELRKNNMTAPCSGVIEVPAYNYQAIHDIIEQNIFYTHLDLITAMHNIHSQLFILLKSLKEDGKSMDLITTQKCDTPCELGSFLELQRDTLQLSMKRIKEDWCQKVISIVQNDLDRFFNFFEDDIERFESSRMKKFLRLTNFVLSAQLRDYVFDELHKLRDFIIPYRYRGSDHFDANEVSGFEPLFIIKIVEKIENGESKIAFDPPLESVLDGLRQIFYGVLEETNFIPGIGETLFPLLTLKPEQYCINNLELRLEKDTKGLWKDIQEVITSNFREPEMLLSLYKGYEHCLKLDPVAFATEFYNEHVGKTEMSKLLSIFREELARLKSDSEEVYNISTDNVNFNLLRVDCSGIKNSLYLRTDGTAKELMKLISKWSTEESSKITQSFRDVYSKVQIIPQTAEELDSLKKYLTDCTKEIERLQSQFATVKSSVHLLSDFSFNLDMDDFTVFVDTHSWPKKVYGLLEDSTIRLEEDKRKFMDELQRDINNLLSNLDLYEKIIERFAVFDDLEKTDQYYEKVKDMESKLEEAKKNSELYNNRERMFNMNTTEFSKLKDLEKNFKPYFDLWRIAYEKAQNFPKWNEGTFMNLDAKFIDESLSMWQSTLKNLEKNLQPKDETARIITRQVKKEVVAFLLHMPLINALRKDGLRQRHWQKIAKLPLEFGKSTAQLDIESINIMNLGDFTKIGFEEKPILEKIIDISTLAEKEAEISKNLEKMYSAWKNVNFHLEKYGITYKLVELDELQVLLDEQIVLTQGMRASPYVKELETEVIAWENKLLERQDIMTEWIKCQVAYLYLEPIFSSQDISAQLPDEATKFGMVDKMWKNVMEVTNKVKVVAQVVSDENMRDNFETANKRLEQIHFGLKQYLETKRRAFPRFYFLSDDELLEILSETKDPLRVQPHLKKCFEGIERLEFDKEGKIVAMLSKQGERIPFQKHVIPAEKNGRVELWLLEIENEMKGSLRHSIEQSINAYAAIAGNIDKRGQWILAWPGQVVLTVSQLFWTREVEESIKAQGVKGVQRYYSKMTKQQKSLIELVRGENLTALQSITLGAMVVIDVHARDVVAGLVKEAVGDISDFEWQSQLRYYWEDVKDIKDGKNQNQIVVRQVTAEINYGYEYLGNQERLVITPLTDRCYRTLTGALQLFKGGAPEGPAGTGKTETTKDLAKAIAKHCVVYNCSDDLTYESMAQFFRGLASSGAWSCFDEFNRIELDVLSVVAQQIQTIQLAVASRATRFFFENMEINMNPTCAIFITMNPGYAGRSELPDNLKALFRPVAMMVPDYALIAEISLFSYGFLEGRKLARKIVSTYRLCSEQLSSQDHYDYGMRAVKAVLVRAGSLKRQFPDLNEEQLMLRALNDVNLPKFVSADIPLFNGIIKDLFPTTEHQKVDYSALENALIQTCAEMNLQPVPYFIQKIIQLYEMIIVRHGLMLVGFPMSGKTASYIVLKSALEKLGEKINLRVLSPKAVYGGNLYGYRDTKTKDWKDGVLALHFQKLSTLAEKERKWLMCDGPVDAIWIESMNTVLDDNKKLCLTSGQIIKMGENMNMMFEVQDLAAASPATVSRCGMVYLEAEKLGSWEPYLASWLSSKEFPQALRESKDFEEVTELFKTLFSTFIPPAIKIFKSHFMAKAYVRVKSDAMLVNSLINILQSLMDEFADPKVIQNYIKDKSIILECLFQFALIWSVGIVSVDRVKFDQLYRNMLEERARNKVYKFQIPMPEKPNTLVFDFVFDKKSRKWVEWTASEYAPKFAVSPTEEFRNIIVPTMDTIRFQFILKTLLDHGKQPLFVGPTGTGKSEYVKQFLLKLGAGSSEEKEQNNEPKSNFLPAFINFSATTTPSLIQDILESKLTRRKQGYIGPPIGKKTIIFVDDLNLPTLDDYGAQPTIELLREWQDRGGWHEKFSKQAAFTHVVDVLFVCAMGPPGGGRNEVTPRFIRHFNVIGLTSFDNQTLTTIFSDIMDWFLSSNSINTISKILARQIVVGSINLFNNVIEQFRPTPEKSHYTFNLRDLSKIFQGVCSVGPRLDGSELEKVSLVKIWAHEATRVFHDRLINEQDRESFYQLLDKELQIGEIKYIIEETPFDYRNTLFTSLTHDSCERFKEVVLNKTSNNPKVADISKLHNILSSKLEIYNDSHSKMDLVLFNFAIEHIVRIVRIITQPGGNALLIGVGGSGRQSLTKLAAFAAEYKLFGIQLTRSFTVSEWKDKMKELLISVGGAKKTQTVFLFNDNQIKYQEFLEDISSILNTGEIPNLFDRDEYKDICESLRAHARNENKGQTPEELYNFFVDRCKECLHIVLCMSPVGENLRNYLRMFPSLVNCCNIDWFSSWPDQALHAVAQKFIKSINEVTDEELDNNVEIPKDDAFEKDFDKYVDICAYFHNSSTELSKQFLFKMKRHNYVTPTTYLGLLKNFSSLVKEKRTELQTLRGKFELGLQRIAETDKDVNEMQKELEILQPNLIELSKQNEELSKKIEIESQNANEKAKKIEIEQEEINAQVAKNEQDKVYCMEELAQAEPIWIEAQQKVKDISTAQIAEVRGMQAPPEGVKMVLKAICIMKGEKVKTIDDGLGNKSKDWWGASKEMMSRKDFLKYIKNFDMGALNQEIVGTLTPILAEMDVEKIKRSSAAAFALNEWLNALVKYFRVNSVVEPKRLALQEAEQKCAEAARYLAEKKRELAEIQGMIALKETERKECEAKKNQLEHEYQLVSVKLERATKLIGLLEGEKLRWQETLAKIMEQQTCINGDVILASGIISYLGAFTSEYRRKILKKWSNKLTQHGIKFSENFTLSTTLAESMEVRNWIIKEGLPSDDFSVENATIVKRTTNIWPLFIDPQGQAMAWIKEKEKQQKKDADSLLIIQMSNPSLIKSLEKAITQGTTTIVEGVGEELDPALEPLLTQRTYYIGGVKYINLSDTPTIYNDNFKLYLVTSLSNPHYLPEVSTKVQIINFMITPNGLEEQLLAIVVKIEEKKLESEKNNLAVQNAKYQEQLKHYQDKILQLLQTSRKIEQKQIETKKTEKDIDTKRNLYRPVAENASTLFFAICELPNVDPMYQYSLNWYQDLFTQCVVELPHEENRSTIQKIEQLRDFFTHQMYTRVCRSLFQKDKLLFSLLLCIQLMRKKSLIDHEELKFLLTGTSSVVNSDETTRKLPEWITQNMYNELCQIDGMSSVFKNFKQEFFNHLEAWKKVYDSSKPNEEPYPDKWNNLSILQKMMVLRIIRPDKLLPAVETFVEKNMDKRFIEPSQFNLKVSYMESTPVKPLIFILSPGVDPMENLRKFADQEGVALKSLSLGQGQEEFAIEMINQGSFQGNWVVLQNCHVLLSFLPKLEKIIDDFARNENKLAANYRLWLTSMPSEKFPVSVLQRGVKITNEPPKGLRANLLQSWNSDPINDAKYFTGCKKSREFKKLLFGLTFFHSLVQERRTFGPLGWNIRYEFNDSDLNISLKQLQMFLNGKDSNVPFKALTYLTGECNYGGRVTDDHDRRTLMAILSDFYNEEIIEDGYQLSPSGIYTVPNGDKKHSEYIQTIEKFPSSETPEVFGLHENATISKDQTESKLMFDALLTTQQNSAPETNDEDDINENSHETEVLYELAADILTKLPDNFIIEGDGGAEAKFKVDYHESMNTVFVQELIRFNKLLNAIRNSLQQLQLALKGLTVMSSDLEQLSKSLSNGKVPLVWSKASYPSRKPLRTYIQDLIKRIEFFNNWFIHGKPSVYWLSGFYFTQSFLTGVKQNFARKNKIAIDQIDFEFEILDKYYEENISLPEPECGCYVYGLFLEGAAWDRKKKCLTDPRPKQLFDEMPIIWFKPVDRSVEQTEPTSSEVKTKSNTYVSPLYRTSERRGTLTTTGHSTNFVMSIKLPMASDNNEKYWIKRGCALLCQLD
ncbi:hypothetical protein NAEGRDRAFT_81845 [Naegleria gruberi]|uniref:Dynein heavy chain n=1 Tax=Naegleria gruberi TaxID=5762 RepID=D2VZN3_NAEGR|nr:uncharacterized protein NAEGRDRAFT_81845 [Naegleria gruberi]EFC37691.1 hypothetical protein NAEGRDRAFT_81845 [Naegleria gruberi]|eukprot:XP_002670435.1 hypothetical protein NAEGRDRAFT_81845 [Naegleria gruberi strain NEG-M]